MRQDDAYHIHIAYTTVILRRFLKKFQKVTLHGVSICKYLYSPFIDYLHQRWNLGWAKENLSYVQDEMNGIQEIDLYSLFDEPYVYESHPNGIVLLSEWFTDEASFYLPKERYYFLTDQKNSYKVKGLEENYLNIDQFFRDQDNSRTVEQLIRQIAEVIHEEKDDPIMGSIDLFEWFKNQIPDTVHKLNAVQSLFETLNIGAVVTIVTLAQVNWIESALNLIAKTHEIPSLVLQPAQTIHDKCDLFFHIPLFATKKMVWGKSAFDWYQKYGYPESRISIVGCTKFDRVFGQKWCGKEKFCQKYNIDSSKKIVVLTTQQGIGENILPIVLKGLATIPEVFLVVLLHPNENGCFERYQQIIAGYAHCKVFRFGILYDALSAADLFLTGFSMSAFEAMFFKLPVITVESFLREFPSFSYQRDIGYSLSVTNSDEVNHMVNRLISDAVFREEAVKIGQEFVTNYCMVDGLSTKRFFDEIEKMCQTGGIA